jgi:hypothetical protein
LPDESAKSEVETGYGSVNILQKSGPAGFQEDEVELKEINQVTLTAEWMRGGVPQSRTIEFYVYRSG